MLRSAFIATICLLVTTGATRAQTAPSSPPPTEASAGPEAMEEAQVGDHWTYELIDDISGEMKATLTNIVTEVSGSEISLRVGKLGDAGAGFVTFDRSWNATNNGIWKWSPNDGTGIRMPLVVGKTWSFKSNDINSSVGFSGKRSGTSKVVAQESVTTSAGTFDTFKIETIYTLQNPRDPARKAQITIQTWYAPLINHWVKRTQVSRRDGRVGERSSLLLVEYGRR